MSYTSSYERINWQNTPSVATPINASNLNKMDSAIKALDEAMGDVSKSNRLFSMSVQSVASNKITAYMGDTSIGEAGDLIMLNTLDKSGTTSSSWSLYLTEPTPGGISKTFALKNVDGSAAYTEAVDAGAIMFVMITGTNTANVVGVINAANIDFPLSVDKGGTGNTVGFIQTGKRAGTTVGTNATIEGSDNAVTGNYSHADGYANTVSGSCATASGRYNNAGHDYQAVVGQFNDNKADTLFEVGNGTANNARSNALEVYSNGHVKDGLGNDMESLSALEATASGNPIVVNAQDVAAKGLKVTLEPIQDLHGQANPYPAGGGKNKLPMTVSAIKALNTAGTWNGNVYTVNQLVYTLVTDDGENIIRIDANGTPTFNAQLNLTNNTAYLSGTYIGNGCPANGGENKYRIRFAGGLNGNDYGSGTGALTADPNTAINVYIRVDAGVTVSNISFYPMLRLSTETDATFAPYSNICPISGRNAVNIVDAGKNYVDSLANETYDAHGTIVSNAARAVTKILALKAGTYAVSVKTSAAGKTPYISISTWANGTYGTNTRLTDTGWQQVQAATITLDEDGYVSALFKYSDDTNITVSDISAQIEVGNNPTPIVPYVTPQTLTIQLGRIVYGGNLNVKTGVGSITHKYVKLTAKTQLSGFSTSETYGAYALINETTDCLNADSSEVYGLCSMCEYVPYNNRLTGKDYNRAYSSPSSVFIRAAYTETVEDVDDLFAIFENVEICYELATPIPFTVSPEVLEMLKGYNYITGDGIIDLVYVPESITGQAEGMFVPISMLGTNESGNTKASRAYTSGEYFYQNGKMYKATTSIANGAIFTVGTNCTQTTLFAELKAAQN